LTFEENNEKNMHVDIEVKNVRKNSPSRNSLDEFFVSVFGMRVFWTKLLVIKIPRSVNYWHRLERKENEMKKGSLANLGVKKDP